MKGTTITKWIHRATLAIMGLFIVACVADAQQISKPSGKDSPQIESELRAGGNFHSSFASSEFAGDGTTVVQGAPFSAVGIKETTQILSDGRRITRRMAQTIYRDAQGRTRHDWGNETKSQTAPRFPIINDPVTGAFYFGNRNLNSALTSPSSKSAQRREVKIITPQSPPDDITKVLGETIEPLGTKTIEGVEAEGVRVTTTIRGTENGVQQPAKVIYERWYSQALRRNILIKVIDPRFGEASYRLIKIDREEPARELFLISAEDSKPGPVKSLEPEAKLRADVPVSVKLERGGKVAVDNRTTGRIVVIGWDKDTVEARATSERGVEAVRFSFQGDPAATSVWLKADYARFEKPETEPRLEESDNAPAPAPENPSPSDGLSKKVRMPGASTYDGVIEPPMRDDRPLEVHLEVRVPRYAEIEVIKVIRSYVEVSGVDTPILVLGNKGDVVLKNVGAVEVRTRTGTVGVENASGLVDVVTASGPVSVRHAGGDVRVLSISGQVEIECARGRVNVDSASGPVRLDNIFGDVDASTSNSDVLFRGALSKDGRYHLKSMSGSVQMALRDKPPGFTAALSSYRGVIENEIKLNIKQASQHEETINRRVIGRYGDGQAQITLDTFDGKVKLGKLAPGEVKECKAQN